MGRLLVCMHVSVDGYIASPRHVEGSWVRVDEEIHRYVNDLTADADALLYGRKVYEVMTPYWPEVAQDRSRPDYEQEFGRLWVDKPKLVLSRTMSDPQWNTRVIRGGVVGEIERGKRESSNYLLSFGGSQLVSSIRTLVDEYLLFVNPVAFGGGTPFFRDETSLELVETRAFRAGAALLRYRRR